MASLSPISWIGGKAKHAARIIELMPEHLVYVEAFGGAGHVLCSKAPSRAEVYNDLNEDLVNFFRVARERCDDLQELVRWVPYSRKQFQEFRQEWKGNGWRKLPDLQRAAIWYSLNRMAFSGAMRSGSWGYTTWRNGRAGSWQPDSMASAVERLRAFRDRLRHVQIECLDYADLITRYDSEGVLLYCDPPYVGTESVYVEGGFGEADHRRLAQLLTDARAKAIISYEDHPLVRELYAGWTISEFETARACHKVAVGGAKKRVVELIIRNC